MSSVRVTYSGLISFAIGISSLVTGLFFTVVVTRQLDQSDFATWNIIGSLTSYVLVIHPVISYWTDREIARGEKSGKTIFFSSGIISIFSTVAYFIIIVFFSQSTEVGLSILIFSAILIPLEISRVMLSAISGGYKPQLAEYGFILSEIIKISLGLLLIFYLGFGLEGAILTIAFSALGNVIFLIISNREKISGKLRFEYFKKWIRLSWLPIYPQISGILQNSDIVIFSIITGSLGGVAYWGAANAVSRIVRHSMKINVGLYPKLLAGGKKEFFEENLTRMLYFSIPLTAISIVFAKPALFILNPIYLPASQIVVIIALTIFLRSLGTVFSSALSGIENVDVNKDASFLDYIKSKLFILPTILNIQKAAYIIALAIFLILFSKSYLEIELVENWAWIGLTAQIPLTIYFYILIQKEFKPKIPIFSIIKYLIIAVISFGITNIVMEKHLIYHESIFEFLPVFLPFFVLGVSMYLGFTYLSDNKTQILINTIILEFRKKSKA